MLSILIFALIVLIIAGLMAWLIDTLPLQSPVNLIAKVVVIIIAILAICNRAGFI